MQITLAIRLVPGGEGPILPGRVQPCKLGQHLSRLSLFPLGLFSIPSHGRSGAARPRLRLPPQQIGAELLRQTLAAGIGTLGPGVVRRPSGHDSPYPARRLGQRAAYTCMGLAAMSVSRGRAEGPHASPGPRCLLAQYSRRRSSVVERVIGNDEVLSSILSGGTIESIS